MSGSSCSTTVLAVEVRAMARAAAEGQTRAYEALIGAPMNVAWVDRLKAGASGPAP